MRALLHDVRYSLRGIVARPGFSLIVILTLALGIGANTAIFSVAEATLRRGLPYPDPDRIVAVWETRARQDFTQMELSYPNFLDLRARQRSFTALAGYMPRSLTLSGARGSERVSAAQVTGEFFDVLGVAPAQGRALGAADETPEASPTVVLGHGFWQRRFGGDPAAVGQTLTINDTPTTIVGVLPRTFAFAPFEGAEMVIPARPTGGMRERRNLHWVRVIGRLQPSATLDTAGADVAGVAGALSVEHPDSNAGGGARIVPLRDEILGKVRPVLWVLLCAVGLVLVVACANVANLILARQTGRQKELAIRAAMGASRRRLFALLLVDSLVHALLAGVAGMLVAIWGMDVLVGAIPPPVMSVMPYLADVRVNAAALAFAFLAALVTGGVVGGLPAWRASRPDVHERLKEEGRGTAGRSRTRLRDALVVTEVAVAFVLLAGAGLVTRSLWRMLSVDPGFDPHGLVTAQFVLPEARTRTLEETVATRDAVSARVAALPGIEAVGMVTILPAAASAAMTARYTVHGKPPAPGELDPEANTRTVSANYFAVMGVPLRAGRAFEQNERPDTLIVNETLARRVFGGDAVGKQIVFTSTKDQPPREIVGVVGDEHLGPLDEAPRPAVYLPYSRSGAASVGLVVRGSVQGDVLARAISEVDRAIPVFGIATMDERIERQPWMFARRFPALLVGAFAGLALALAAIGIYGVLSYTVRQRTHEIGIRRAVGAQGRHILALLLGHTTVLAAAGVTIGLGLALATTRLLGSLLFGISPTDPITLGGAAALLLLVALAASWLPARWAMSVDPLEAMR